MDCPVDEEDLEDVGVRDRRCCAMYVPPRTNVPSTFTVKVPRGTQEGRMCLELGQ